MNRYWKQRIKIGQYLLLGVLFLTACQDSGNWRKGNGFEYEAFTTSAEAPRIAVGDSVWVHYGIYQEGRLLHHSREDGAPYRFLLPPAYEQSFLDKPLPLMAEGDSLWMRVRYDSVRTSLGNYGQLFESGDWVYFGLKVVQVNSRAERKAQREIQYAKARGFDSVERMREELQGVQAQADSLADFMKTQVAAYQAGDLQVDSLPNGLRFHLLEQGKGPIAGRDSLARVFVHYMAALQETGAIYDNSFERGDRLVFELKKERFIPGLRQALLAFPIGSKALVFIPSEQAYGSAGSPPFVPPSSDLAFYIDWRDYLSAEE